MKPLKINEDGTILALKTDGTEVSVSLAELLSSVKTARDDWDREKRAREVLEGKLAKYAPIGDRVDAAVKALEVVAGMDAGAVVKAADVAKRIETEREAWVSKELAPVRQERDAALAGLREVQVRSPFSTSKVLEETRYAGLVDDAFLIFGPHFKAIDGKPVAHAKIGKDGPEEPIYSESNPREYASFDEGLRRIIDMRPDKERVWLDKSKRSTGTKGTLRPGSAQPPEIEDSILSDITAGFGNH